MVLIPHLYLIVTGLSEFARVVHLSVSRTILKAQRYHRCQLPLWLLKSTCSHLVITQDRLNKFSSTVNTYDYTTTQVKCWLYFQTVLCMLAPVRQALVNKRNIFVVFVANCSSRCHRSWMHTTKIHQFSWYVGVFLDVSCTKLTYSDICDLFSAISSWVGESVRFSWSVNRGLSHSHFHYIALDLSHLICWVLSYRGCCQPLRLAFTLSRKFPEPIESTVCWCYLQCHAPWMPNTYQTKKHRNICLSRGQ